MKAFQKALDPVGSYLAQVLLFALLSPQSVSLTDRALPLAGR